MKFLYEYMDENELMLAQESAINENAMVHLNAELKTIAMEHEVRMHDIEMQVLVENGTADDLQALYEREYTIMTEGVSDWWKKFVAKLKQIWNAIIGKCNDVKGTPISDPNEVIEVKGDIKGIKKFLSKVSYVIKNATNFKTEDGKFNTKKLAGTLGITVAGGVGIAAIVKILKNKKTPMKKGDLVVVCDEITKCGNEITNEASKKDVTDKDEADIISTVTNAVQNLVTDTVNSIKGSLGNSDSGQKALPYNDNGQKALPNNNSGQKALPYNDRKALPNTSGPDKVMNRNNTKHQRSGRVTDIVTGNKVAVYPPKKGDGEPRFAVKLADGTAKSIRKQDLPKYIKDRSVLNDMYGIYNDMKSGSKTESSTFIEDFNTFNESSGWRAYLAKSGAIIFEESVDVYGGSDDTNVSESTYDDLFNQYADLDAEEFLESTDESASAYDELISLLEEI